MVIQGLYAAEILGDGGNGLWEASSRHNGQTVGVFESRPLSFPGSSVLIRCGVQGPC